MGMTRVSNLKARAALLVVGLLVYTPRLGAERLRWSRRPRGSQGPLPTSRNREPLAPANTTRSSSSPRSPSRSARAGQTPQRSCPTISNWAMRERSEVNYLTFANVKEVWKPGTTDVVDAPKDLVGWLQHHPYLKTSKPQPVTVGGVKGEQLEVARRGLAQGLLSRVLLRVARVAWT